METSELSAIEAMSEDEKSSREEATKVDGVEMTSVAVLETSLRSVEVDGGTD